MIKHYIKKLVPEKYKKLMRKNEAKKLKEYTESLQKLSEEEFRLIIIDKLGIRAGDTVFIHSANTGLNLDFSSFNILNILLDIVGPDGTVLFPAYPKKNSYDFLCSNEIFDLKKSATYTGLLNEMARRHKSSFRSLHPTKSVVAIGANAKGLISGHNKSPYPYDIDSPYYKITKVGAKIIGLGVESNYLSCVHCADDLMKEKFPVKVYHDKLFDANCIDENGNSVIVKTYAHNIMKMEFDLPKFFKKYTDNSVCEDLNIKGMKFFRADADKVVNRLLELAEDNITIYKKIHYKPRYWL